MYVLEESDCAIVPMKLTNNEGKTSAESAEGRSILELIRDTALVEQKAANY